MGQQRKEFCSHNYPVYPKASDNYDFLCLKYNHHSKSLSSTYLEAQKALKGKTTTCLFLLFLPRHQLLGPAGDSTLSYIDLDATQYTLVSSARVLNFLLKKTQNKQTTKTTSKIYPVLQKFSFSWPMEYVTYLLKRNKIQGATAAPVAYSWAYRGQKSCSFMWTSCKMDSSRQQIPVLLLRNLCQVFFVFFFLRIPKGAPSSNKATFCLFPADLQITSSKSHISPLKDRERLLLRKVFLPMVDAPISICWQ